MVKLPLLVIGAKGQIGSALLKVLKETAVGIDLPEFDLMALDQISGTLQKINPGAIINAAAYTQVDQAEVERDLALKINALAPEIMAQYCFQNNIPFVHYSTDYVYPGVGHHFMTEEESYNPCNFYGKTKLLGDQKVVAVGGKFLIFRTCWVYDASGRNFLNTILRLASEREELAIVNDQIGAPSFAGHLAQATVSALDSALSRRDFPSGIYHLCNCGVTSWYDFAIQIIKGARDLGVPLKVQKIRPISSEEFKSKACRPKNSRLSMEKLKTVFGISMPSWQTGLNQCLREKYESNKFKN